MPQTKTKLDDEQLVLALASLTGPELKIYKSLMQHFPASDPWSAYDKAIQGGVNWQFNPS